MHPMHVRYQAALRPDEPIIIVHKSHFYHACRLMSYGDALSEKNIDFIWENMTKIFSYFIESGENTDL